MTTADIRNALLTAAGDAADELNRLAADVEQVNAQLATEQATSAAQRATIADLMDENAALRDQLTALTPKPAAVFGVDKGGLDLAPEGFGFFRGPYLPAGTLDKPLYFDGNRGRVADAYAKGCRTFSVSYKDRGQTAMNNLTGFLASFPADATILLTYFHEHDGNIRDGSLSLADYRQGCREARQVADAVGAKFGPIHNGVNLVGGKWGVYPDVWAANAPDVPVDFWGTDMYFKEYEDPADKYGPAVEYAQALGVPLVIGETAAPGGADQAPWAKAARAYLDGLDIDVHAAWWSQPYTKNGVTIDYRMTPATVTEWWPS